jgi:ABC-type branched-subunit amino acid transport system substrate-binding protein
LLPELLFGQTVEVIKVGFASPLTGPQGHYGQDNLNGARLAIEDLNTQHPKIGGKPVAFELVAEDDQADPKTGTIVAQRLVDAGIKGMVGHFNSGVTIPASRIYNEAGIPELSVSTNVNYTRQGYRTAFRVMADDGKQGRALGEYAVKVLKLTRLAVIDDRTAYWRTSLPRPPRPPAQLSSSASTRATRRRTSAPYWFPSSQRSRKQSSSAATTPRRRQWRSR